MKARNVANYFIAGTVIFCSLILFSTLVFAITGFRLRAPSRTLDIDFRDVTGIKAGTPVRFAGKPAGTVVTLRHLSADERRQASDPSYVLRVTVELEDWVPPLTTDVHSGIASESFLGNKFVALTPGKVTADPLPQGAVIQATDRGLLEMVQRVGSSLETMLDNVNADYRKLVPRVTGLLDRADGMVTQGTNLVGNLNGAVMHVQELALQLKTDYNSAFGPRISSILAQVQTLGTNVTLTLSGLNTNTTATLNQLRELLQANRANLDKMISDLRVVSQNLKVTTTYAKALTGQLSEKPSRLIWGRKKLPLPSEQEILDTPEPLEIPLGPEEGKK